MIITKTTNDHVKACCTRCNRRRLHRAVCVTYSFGSVVPPDRTPCRRAPLADGGRILLHQHDIAIAISKILTRRTSRASGQGAGREWTAAAGFCGAGEYGPALICRHAVPWLFLVRAAEDASRFSGAIALPGVGHDRSKQALAAGVRGGGLTAVVRADAALVGPSGVPVGSATANPTRAAVGQSTFRSGRRARMNGRQREPERRPGRLQADL